MVGLSRILYRIYLDWTNHPEESQKSKIELGPLLWNTRNTFKWRECRCHSISKKNLILIYIFFVRTSCVSLIINSSHQKSKDFKTIRMLQILRNLSSKKKLISHINLKSLNRFHLKIEHTKNLFFMTHYIKH